MQEVYQKVKRAATSLLLPISRHRRGRCLGCGACCKFLYRCPFLKIESNGTTNATCLIYRVRPPVCKKYPRTKSEQVHMPCGYYFTDHSN